MQRIADTLFWTLIALWLAFALAGGIAAASIFPAARGLPLSLEGYEGFIAASPEQGRMLVAGHLAESVFAKTDGVRLLLAPLAVLALLAQVALAPRATRSGARFVWIAVAATALLVGTFWSQPAFTARDAEYRTAARTGRGTELLANATDSGPKLAVDAAHQRASWIAGTEALALLFLIAVSAWNAGGSSVRNAAAQDCSAESPRQRDPGRAQGPLPRRALRAQLDGSTRTASGDHSVGAVHRCVGQPRDSRALQSISDPRRLRAHHSRVDRAIHPLDWSLSQQGQGDSRDLPVVGRAL